MIKSSAPGKIILFGEHAVVHQNSKGEYCLGISTAVDKRCYVTIEEGEKNLITINSVDLKIRKSKTFDEISELIDEIDALREQENYKEIKNISLKHKLVPVYTVVEKIMKKYGEYRPLNMTIESCIPKNMGSSGSVCSAAASAVIKYLGKDAGIEEIGSFANEGDKNAHGKASGIDAKTSTYGGWNTYTQAQNVKPLKSGFNIPLVVVESGKPADTSKTVGHFIEMKNESPEKIFSILDELDEISHEALDYIEKTSEIEKIGELFFEYYDALKRVDEIFTEGEKIYFATEEFKKIIQIAKDNDFYAKPTGGWGGGICIATGKDLDEIMLKYNKEGFRCFKVLTGAKGARIESA